MHEKMEAFVRQALERKVSREAIAAALRRARWRDEEIRTALGAYADDPEVGIPVPRRKASVSASEAFQYLTVFLCLTICALAAGSLGFNLIDSAIPDPRNPYDVWSPSSVRLALASIVVALPVYVFLTAASRKAVRADPVKRESPVRKWLTYLTLFVTGGVAIGDLITLIDGLFEGAPTVRFVLKTLTVLCIAGGIFAFYLRDLRRDERAS